MFGRKSAVRKTKSWNEAKEKCADRLYIDGGTVGAIIDLAARLSESGYPDKAVVKAGMYSGATVTWETVETEEPIK